MKLVHTVAELREEVAAAKAQGFFNWSGAYYGRFA